MGKDKQKMAHLLGGRGGAVLGTIIGVTDNFKLVHPFVMEYNQKQTDHQNTTFLK
jgi:hypothetical protein